MVGGRTRRLRLGAEGEQLQVAQEPSRAEVRSGLVGSVRGVFLHGCHRSHSGCASSLKTYPLYTRCSACR